MGCCLEREKPSWTRHLTSWELLLPESQELGPVEPGRADTGSKLHPLDSSSPAAPYTYAASRRKNS